MNPSQTNNAIRLRKRRRAIRLGLPIPRMTKEEVSAVLSKSAKERSKKFKCNLRHNKFDPSTLRGALKKYGFKIGSVAELLGICPKELRNGWRDGNGIGAKMLREFEKERGLNLGIREPMMDTPYPKNARTPGHKWMSPALKKLFP